MLFTTNISKENMYWDCKGKILHSLNASLQESLDLNPFITLITFFWVIKICILQEELPQNIIP
jgi:hypothetical protein